MESHRVIIASLFLPLTAVVRDEPLSITPPAQSPQPPATKAASRRGQPLESIVDDLATKSRLATPLSTPNKEATNPFISFSSIASSIASLKPPVAPPSNIHTLRRRVSRIGSRSSSLARPARSFIDDTSYGSPFFPWVFEQNPQANGGLYNAIKSVDATLKKKLWVGVLGSTTDSLDGNARKGLTSALREQDCLPVWFPDAQFSACYDVFCHQVLWPILHYAIPDAPKTKKFYELGRSSFSQFEAVNQAFADAIVAAYQPGDIVWVNDYHLMLVPKMVRDKLPNAIIGFFLHVAWPSSEIFRCLPVREQLLWGVLGADLVGVQTHNLARHFRNCVSRVLALESFPKGIQLPNSFVDVAVFPMGIDVALLDERRKEPEVAEWVALLKQRYPGMKLIVGRDKLDESQGMRQKVLAFEDFLVRYPEFQGKAVLIQVALFTTEENELQGRVTDVVSRVNSRFSTLTYQPVVFLHTQDVTFSQYIALLTVADTFLVTSLREGMALRTHEYVQCQDERARPLILSEFTGSYSFTGFRSCIPINPWDTKATADAIHSALTMSDAEARARWTDLHNHVIKQNSVNFVTSFVAQCERVHTEHQQRPLDKIPLLKASSIAPAYLKARRTLLIVDFESTLWDRDPKNVDAALPSEVDALLAKLPNEKTEVWLLSGLSKSVLEKEVGKHVNIGLCAENGCFIRPKSDWINMVPDIDLSWKPAVLEILNYFSERTPGSWVEERDASVVWRFWTGTQSDVTGRTWALRSAAEAQNHINDSLGERFGLRIIPGANSFLILPNRVSRSTAVGEVLRRCNVATRGPATDDNFVFALTRDEKLLARMNAVPGAETVTTGEKGNDAKWRLAGPEGVIKFLGDFVAAR